MPLVLTFTGSPPDGLPPRYVVPPAGASIGRGQANDFVLPDPEQKLSRRHCEVRPERGGWLLFDNSTNGTFMNDQPERLDPRVPVLLQNGDSIILGDHVLVVQIEADAAPQPDYPLPVEQPVSDINAGRFDDFDRLRSDPGSGAGPVDDPFAAFDLEPPPPGGGQQASADFRLNQDLAEAPPPSRQSDLYQVGRVDPAPDFSAEADDPFAAFDLDAPPQGTGAQADHADHGAVQFAPPPSRRDVIPDDWMDEPPEAPPPPPPAARSRPEAPVTVPGDGQDDHGFDTPADPRQASVPPLRPAAPPAYAGPPVDANDALSLFLAGAGISPQDRPSGDSAAAIQLAGQIFRVMVEGARDLIQTRARLKNEFRIEQTMIGSANNNPLKFAVTAEEALAAMVQPPRQGYLGPVEAAREVFADLRAHEIAVMVALQSAMKSVLKRMDPATIKAKVDGEGGGFSIGGGKKTKYWDLYELLFGEVVGGLDEDFDKIFGRAFAAAYEDQIRRL